MKNEEKIIELLSEYLKKLDKHEQEMIELRKDFHNEMNTFRFDLNHTNVRQEALMKEIFSISKPVANLEDNS